ncbi:MAG: LuxR C-terminal-related transcriptional regulator, partial [Acidobacteriota bacterium]
LTKAEERIAKLVAQSLSNKKIAANLNISVRTVEMHISNILSKKQFSNRVEIARYIIKLDSAE